MSDIPEHLEYSRPRKDPRHAQGKARLRFLISSVQAVTSAALFISGWIIHAPALALSGCILFAAQFPVILAYSLYESRQCRSGRWTPQPNEYERNNRFYWIPEVTHGVTWFAGMGMYGVPPGEEFISPAIIVVLELIVSYALQSMIISLVAGIPMRMTYGGWKVDSWRSRQGRRRRY